jgi:predicted AlkP superfamily pyrophosphatase or phosphodiesterase
MKRFLVVLAALLVASSCATVQSPTAEKPRLVVVLVVDGLPQWQVLAYRDQLAPGGFRRFLDRGAWFSDAHQSHAFTVTAAGHAAVLTGAYPRRHGIIGNEWIDPATGAVTYCTEDASATYIGHKTPPHAGTSPKLLRGETLGDVLRRSSSERAKVVGISGKDRGAILLAGKTGTAYMFMDEGGRFASSTYYMAQHPAWVTAFNAAGPADRYFRAEWAPLLDDAAYARSLPDGRPWYKPDGKLPQVVGARHAAPNARFYEELRASPFIDQLTLAFARAAIAGESLGADDVPDILAVSLSGHDYVNHEWTAESRLSQDHFLRLDRMLEGFFDELDRTIGRDAYLVVLTADHGFTPAPEHSRELGRDAERFSIRDSVAKVNRGLEARFGAGRWARWSGSGVLIDARLVAQKGLARAEVEEEVRRVLLTERGIVEAYTRTELESGRAPAGAKYFAASQRMFDGERLADVQVIVRPYWLASSSGRGAGTSHGSPYDYDSRVPILLYGPRWIAPGRMDAPVEVVNIAPTLAAILGIASPALSEGRTLPLRAPGS